MREKGMEDPSSHTRRLVLIWNRGVEEKSNDT